MINNENFFVNHTEIVSFCYSRMLIPYIVSSFITLKLTGKMSVSSISFVLSTFSITQAFQCDFQTHILIVICFNYKIQHKKVYKPRPRYIS